MSNKERSLSEFIERVDNRNIHLHVENLKGINVRKEFIPSVANINGSDMRKYKLVYTNQFAYNPMHVGRDRVVPISLHTGKDPILVSPAYTTFEIIRPTELIPEYLMEWFKRPEFDKKAWFVTDSSVRGGFNWESLIELEIIIPSIDDQILFLMKDILQKQKELNSIKKRITDWL